MEFSLQPDEASLLKEILKQYLSNLRLEIGGTDSYDFRQGLKKNEEAIKALIARLEQAGVS